VDILISRWSVQREALYSFTDLTMEPSFLEASSFFTCFDDQSIPFSAFSPISKEGILTGGPRWIC
jgi:hypothetical protein